jgi:uncharacterized small protein (DUF1192 family)
MAKALYGHLGTDPLLVTEVTRLRRRVRELEDDLARLRAEVEEAGTVHAAAEDLSVEELLTLDAHHQPALT